MTVDEVVEMVQKFVVDEEKKRAPLKTSSSSVPSPTASSANTQNKEKPLDGSGRGRGTPSASSYVSPLFLTSSIFSFVEFHFVGERRPSVEVEPPRVAFKADGQQILAEVP